jgi:subtilisin-like proprotein convertase family protein
MRRVSRAFLRSTGLLLLPTVFVTGCPGDETTPSTGTDTESPDDTSDSDDPSNTLTDPSTTTSETDSTTEDPSTSTDPTDPDSSSTDPDSSSTDPDSSSTDPDSSSTDPGSSSTDPGSSSSSGGELCGNGEIDDGEECDGDALGGADCESEGFDQGTISCDACALDTTACVLLTCGNGALDGKELCDGGTLDGADCVSEGFALGGELACASSCADYDTSGCIVSDCGNDIIEGPEVCDGVAFAAEDTCVGEGFAGGELGCAASCLALDTSSCVSQLCGNDIREDGEVCDGPELGANTCVTLGFDGGSPLCADDCQSFTNDSCFGEHVYCATPDLPIADFPGPGALSDIVVQGLAGAVTDVDVYVDISHGWVSDLDVYVGHVESFIAVELTTDSCDGNDDIDATFDAQAAAAPDCVNPIAIEGSVLPEGDLTTFTAGNGTWRLAATDDEEGVAGTLNQWCVAITTVNSGQQDFDFTGVVEAFVVPDGVTTLTIDASGAQGGGLAILGAGGLGARIVGDFDVAPGDEITVVVGQQGQLQVDGSDANSSGGGGGSFVYLDDTLLVAAGGGGGRCNFQEGALHVGAAGTVDANGGSDASGESLGGVAGAGGDAGVVGPFTLAGGGAGWLSNGGSIFGGLNADELWTGGPGICDGGGGGCGGAGGFGGGGGGGNFYGGGGGGGGYSGGGGGGDDPSHGGGGGSLNEGEMPLDTTGVRAGNGAVVISW